MPNEDKSYYTILKDKDGLLSPITVGHATVRSEAEKAVDRLTRELTEEERKAGWSYVLQKGTTKAPIVKRRLRGKKEVKGRKRARRGGR